MLDPILEWCAPKGDEFGKTESREKNLRRLGEDAVSGNCLAILVKGFFVIRKWMKEKQRALRN